MNIFSISYFQNYHVTMLPLQNLSAPPPERSLERPCSTDFGVFHADLSRFHMRDMVTGGDYSLCLLKTVVRILQVGVKF